MDPAPGRDIQRRRIRERRERLNVAERREAARSVAEALAARPFMKEARHVAGYHAVGGELDPAPILEQCASDGARLYLPVLDPDRDRALLFREWTPETPLNRNRLGIPEPAGTPLRDPRRLDVVLVPLVVCDRGGNRLGMGGGFYDTTFAWRVKEEPGRPRLVGLAYGFQVVDRLDPMPWDVPLGHIATPDGVFDC